VIDVDIGIYVYTCGFMKELIMWFLLFSCAHAKLVFPVDRLRHRDPAADDFHTRVNAYFASLRGSKRSEAAIASAAKEEQVKRQAMQYETLPTGMPMTVRMTESILQIQRAIRLFLMQRRQLRLQQKTPQRRRIRTLRQVEAFDN
jgi:hypothetical protein